jgi:F-type H+-transporting ATPase subunit a
MASAVLHIKDSYYFEVPKFLWRYRAKELRELPPVWIQLDPHFQDQQRAAIMDAAADAIRGGGYPEWQGLTEGGSVPIGSQAAKVGEAWKHWQHEKGNHGKPFFVYLEEYARQVTSERAKAAKEGKEYTGQVDPNREWFVKIYENPTARRAWNQIVDFHRPDRLARDSANWSTSYEPEDASIIEEYNRELSGKIIIPQPFGRLRNLYQAESGFCISKYMVIELMVAVIMFVIFSWVAKKVRNGDAPKGKMWNLFESLLVFVKKDIAEKAIDHHYAHKYLPFLWTAFFFVLGCNLMGMLPWLGSPTASFGTTTALAFSTLLVVVVWAGMKKWGVLGFFKNIVPTIDLPWWLFPLKVAIVVGLFFIELLGLIIKHLVLAIRLLANMVAGHLVLVSILFIAFEFHAVQAMNPGSWYIAAPISILGVTALSLLELFVAFLQAYVFTFLSALFIDSVLHHH